MKSAIALLMLACVVLMGTRSLAREAYQESYFCEGVIAYMMNYVFMKGEKEKALILALQTSRTMTFNLYVNTTDNCA
jgi:hypothetical protein